MPVLFPVHPRTRERLGARVDDLPAGLQLIDPVGYLDFLSLEADAGAVLTDSGGIQEETTYLGVPCFTLRDNTERPVTIEAGTNRLLGLDPARIDEIPGLLASWNAASAGPSAGLGRTRGGAARGRSCGISECLSFTSSGEAAIFPPWPASALPPRTGCSSTFCAESGQNAVRSATLLKEMLEKWPDGSEGLNREILKSEQEGDRITHDIIRRLNSTFVTPFDREDIYGLATQVDDVVDYIEEAGDFLGLYQIEAPMQQSLALAEVLVASCGELAEALAGLRGFKDLDRHLIEIHRLENDGDRISRDAVASLFANGIDPMVVIRWKDIFAVLEKAIDATETAAHIIEGVAIKNA